MPNDDEIPTVSISDYVTVIARRWLVVALGTALGAGLALGFLVVTPPEATATSVVSVAPIVSDPYSANRASSSLVDIQTESQAASSMAVATLAAQALDNGIEPSDLRGRLSTTPIDATTVMRIAVTAPSAEEARAEADAIAQAYLGYRSKQATERIKAVLDQNEAKLTDLRAQLATANAALAAADEGSAAFVQAQTDQQLIQSQITTLVERSSTFEDVDTSGGQVLTSAEVNKVSWAPSKLPVLAGGILAGLVLGLVGAFVRQAMDRRVRLGADIVSAGVGPVLARLSDRETPRSEHDAGELALARERLLATAQLADGTGILALVEDFSCLPAPDVAADLALAFAEGGVPVEVVCVPTADTYQAVLAGRLGLAQANRSGALTAPSQPLLSAWWSDERTAWTRATRRHLERTSSNRKLVLLVCPSAAGDADRMAAARLADAVVVYAVERVSRRASLHSVALSAQAVGTPVVGAVVAAHSQQVLDGADAHTPRHHAAAAAPAPVPDPHWSPVLGAPVAEEAHAGAVGPEIWYEGADPEAEYAEDYFEDDESAAKVEDAEELESDDDLTDTDEPVVRADAKK